VPMTPLECDELGAVHACNRRVADGALVGVELPVALDAARPVVDGRESLSAKHSLAVGAAETVTVPGAVVEHDSTLPDRLAAFRTVLAILMLVTRDADDISSTRDEAVRSNRFLAVLANEAVGVPLSSAMLVLLHAGSKHVTASGTARGEHLFVACGAVEPVVLEGERLVDESGAARRAVETFVVPVHVLVRQILVVGCDRRSASGARVGEFAVVAVLAVGLVISQ